MISPFRLLIGAVATSLLLAGCASSSSRASATPSPARAIDFIGPGTSETGSVVVTGDGADSDHRKVDAADNQILQAEHANDPDSTAVSNASNQGIP